MLHRSKTSTISGLPLERTERPPTPERYTETRHTATMGFCHSASCSSPYPAAALPTSCRRRLHFLRKRQGKRPNWGTCTVQGLLGETCLEDREQVNTESGLATKDQPRRTCSTRKQTGGGQDLLDRRLQPLRLSFCPCPAFRILHSAATAPAKTLHPGCTPKSPLSTEPRPPRSG